MKLNRDHRIRKCPRLAKLNLASKHSVRENRITMKALLSLMTLIRWLLMILSMSWISMWTLKWICCTSFEIMVEAWGSKDSLSTFLWLFLSIEWWVRAIMQCSRKKLKCFSLTNFWSVVSKKIFWTLRSDKARPEFFELACSIFWKQWQLSKILNWNEFFVDSLLDSTKVILRDKRFFWGMSQILRLSLQVR